jgi:ribonuclease HIII
MEKNSFVVLLDLSLKDQLLKKLKNDEFEISQPPYTLNSGKKKGLSVTLFESGKCVIQGKEAKDFMEFYMEPELLKVFTTTQIDTSARIGIDESGKGDFFGPLCVAGVFAGDKEVERLKDLGVRDSKTLSDISIHSLANKIKREFKHQIIVINPLKYNEIYASFKNLNALLGWGHATALQNLIELTGCKKAIIDQFADERVVLNALKRKKVELDLTQRHRGEEDLVVAAASILARDAFVNRLKTLSEEAGILLPKGASAAVVKAGRALVKKFGEEKLPYFAKMHFKTLDSVIEID